MAGCTKGRRNCTQSEGLVIAFGGTFHRGSPRKHELFIRRVHYDHALFPSIFARPGTFADSLAQRTPELEVRRALDAGALSGPRAGRPYPCVYRSLSGMGNASGRAALPSSEM